MGRIFGSGKSEESQSKLRAARNVLCCYVKRNPTIGYCQGFNFVVAHLLRHMSEEEAFWTFCAIIEVFLPLDYYACMLGVLVDQGVFRRLVKKTLPNVWGVMRRHKVAPDSISMKWFICLFSHNAEAEVADELWNRLFLYGPKVVFKAALAMLSLLEKDILKSSGLGCPFLSP